MACYSQPVHCKWTVVIGAVVAALLMTSCGGDDQNSGSSPSSVAQSASALPNACPVNGCHITITDVSKEGSELRITWKTDFGPDFSKNHVHVFWDTYTAAEVSNDAAAHGKVQGEWVPTGANPTYVTGGAVSTAVRGKSTTLCVSAANRDHNVLDPSIVDCRNVANLL